MAERSEASDFAYRAGVPDLRPGPYHLLLKGAARVRARGPREALGLVWMRAREAIRSDDALVVHTRPAGGGMQEDPELQVRAASTADAERYARDIGTDSPRTFAARLTERTTCFVVVSEGRFVHSSWATTGAAWTRELRRYVRPREGHAYVYESFTRAEVRGRGIYPYALRAICARLSPRGVETVWVAVEKDNPASSRALAKAGFKPAFEVFYRRRWGRVIVDVPPATDGLEIVPSTSLR